MERISVEVGTEAKWSRVSPLPGQFEKGMKVQLARTGKTIALTRPQKLFAQERSTMETGFAGDGRPYCRCFFECFRGVLGSFPVSRGCVGSITLDN